MIDLTGKVAIVTGGASGIGCGICLVLAEQGATVVATDVNLEGAQSVASEVAALGRPSAALRIDVTDRSSVEDVVSRTISEHGRVDILINDAGVIGAPGWQDRENPTDADWDYALAVNLRGVVICSEAVASHMKARRYGKIVNIASIAARQGGTDIPHYNASKAAVVSWTQSNALQLAPYDVNVNAICPGLLWTPMWEGIARKRSASGFDPSLAASSTGSTREYFEKTVEAWIPMKKEQTPEDVGKLAAFLVSDDAHNITGQAINVDGGRRMN